ncbi:lytic transglycosylase, partial [Salmonella enterica]|nr:lytic transglycosylase [Salmonella enterica]
MKNAIFIMLLMSFSLTSFSNCFETIGKAYNIDPLLLESIALNES